MDLKRSMLYPEVNDVNTLEERERMAAASASIGLPVELLPPSYEASIGFVPSIHSISSNEYMPTPETIVNGVSSSLRDTMTGNYILK